MRYEYTHFIQENVAPKGATRIVIKDGDEEVCSIPATRFGGLTHPSGGHYSVGVVSDCHTYKNRTPTVVNDLKSANAKLRSALSYFKSRGCKMVIGCGDFCQTGLYMENSSTTDSMTISDTVLPKRNPVTVAPKGCYYDETQLDNHKNIVNEVGIPVYELYGNHENYFGKDITSETIIDGVVYNSLVRAKELVGIPYTSYTISSAPDSDEVVGTTVRPNRHASVGNDLYIMCGQSTASQPMSASDFEWLKYTLALDENKNRRCFIAVHSYIEGDSGDPLDVRNNSIFASFAKLSEFMGTLAKYPNVMLFHGHSHSTLESQTVDSRANYTTINGFKSVHVPSCGNPLPVTGSNPDGTPYSQCYIMDVYSDYVVLNGLSYVDSEWLPVAVATYKIEV